MIQDLVIATLVWVAVLLGTWFALEHADKVYDIRDFPEIDLGVEHE